MSHLNTAYKIGAALAIRDFEDQIQKEAQGMAPGTPPPGIRQPGTAVPPAPPPTAPGAGNNVNPTLGAPNARVRTM